MAERTLSKKRLVELGTSVKDFTLRPELCGHMSEPVQVHVHLLRNDQEFPCTVYLPVGKYDQLNRETYLELVAQRYNMEAADWDALTNHLPQNRKRGRFYGLSQEYRAICEQTHLSFQRKLEAFLLS